MLARKHQSNIETDADLVDWLEEAPASLLLNTFNMPPISELIDAERELNWAPVVESVLYFEV